MNIGHHAVLEDETASVIVKTGDDLDACTTYFISPDKPMVGRGKRLSSADLCGMTPLEQMTAMFALAREEGRKPVVMGAIPFSEETRPALVLPCDVLYPSRTQVLTDKTTRHTNTAHFIDRIESERNYQKAVENGLTLIRQGMIDKIVLSRQLDLTATRNIDSLDVLRNLLQKHPASYVFSVPHCLSDNTQTGVFIGASPELLVRKHGDFVYANPLAGSVASHPDKAENEKRIAQLTASAKDQQEHRYTVRSVCDVLAQYCDDIVAPDQPEVLTAGPIHHLSSQIKGRLRYSTTTALDLARALHPTPAVGGFPSKNMISRIAHVEGKARGFYAGAVGWCNAAGDGEWAVSLRCAEIDGTHARLFAGAGIVAGSSVQMELNETNTKFKTMFQALNLHGDNTLQANQ